jgi:hypothetical protein
VSGLVFNIDTAPIPLQAQIVELERELALRARVYPRFVASGKMSQKAADHHTDCLRAAIETLKRLKRS